MAETIIMSQVTAGAPSFPCGGCRTFTCDYTGDIDVVVAGINICTTCFPGPPNDYKITAFTGINGSFTAALVAGSGSVVIGTITLTRYESIDGTCDVEFDVQVLDMTLDIICTGDGELNVFAQVGNLFVFQGPPAQTIDTPIPNTILVCEQPSFGVTNAGTDGTVTLSLP